jgi:osomolarity two-component system response regulator SKN7
MPRLDGITATDLIRKFNNRTPIISMSSASQPHDVFKYYKHGMNDVLAKPVTKARLLDILEVCPFT